MWTEGGGTTCFSASCGTPATAVRSGSLLEFHQPRWGTRCSGNATGGPAVLQSVPAFLLRTPGGAPPPGGFAAWPHNPRSSLSLSGRASRSATASAADAAIPDRHPTTKRGRGCRREGADSLLAKARLARNAARPTGSTTTRPCPEWRREERMGSADGGRPLSGGASMRRYLRSSQQESVIFSMTGSPATTGHGAKLLPAARGDD